MHVISYKTVSPPILSRSVPRYPPPDNWYKLASHATWQNLINYVQSLFPTAEAVEGSPSFFPWHSGNRYRLITAIE
jgi:hypothetical protein